MINIRYDATPAPKRHTPYQTKPRSHSEKSTYRIQIPGVPSTQVFIIDHLGLGILAVIFPSFLSPLFSFFVSVIRFADDVQVRGEAFGRCVCTSMNSEGLESGVSGKLSCDEGVVLR